MGQVTSSRKLVTNSKAMAAGPCPDFCGSSHSQIPAQLGKLKGGKNKKGRNKIILISQKSRTGQNHNSEGQERKDGETRKGAWGPGKKDFS